MNNRKYIMAKWESVQDLCKNRMLYRKIDKFHIFVYVYHEAIRFIERHGTADNVSRDARF